MIEFMGGYIYRYVDDKYDFKVSLLSDKTIFLYGDMPYQYFSIPYRIKLEALPKLFKTLEDLMKYAGAYTDGVTNKTKFKIELDRALSQGKIDKNQHQLLVKFIDKTDHPPATVQKQLLIKGFEPICDSSVFSDPDPRLLETCTGFKRFLDEIPYFINQDNKRKGSEHELEQTNSHNQTCG